MIVTIFKNLNKFGMLILLINLSELFTLIFASLFSIFFHNKVTYEYIVTGFASGLLIACLILFFLNRLLNYFYTQEKKILLETLNKEQERFKILYEKTPAMKHSINKEGYIISVSDSWLKHLGYSREEVIGKKSVDFLTKKSQQYAINVILPFFIKNGYCSNVEYEFVKKNGEIISALLSATSELDISGNVERSFAVITDISDRKHAEKREKDILGLLESIVDNIPFSIFVKRASDLRFVLFNLAAEKFIGKNRKDLIGKNDFDIFDEAQARQLTKKDREVLELKGEIDSHEEQITTRLGKRILKAKKLALLDENGDPKYLLGITEDVTEEKLTELEKKIFRDDVESVNRAKSEFITNISHELRTPLNGVIGFADLLLKSELNEQQKQYINIIFQSGNSLLQMLNDILSFTSLEREILDLNLEIFSISELIKQSADIIRFSALEKNLEIKINITKDVPEFMFGDQVRLKQVFLNLLNNAVKFTNSGEIEIKVENNTDYSEKNSSDLIFSVRDTGIGIKKEELHKVFQAFSQVDTSTKRVYGGAGLGLAISARILALMNSSLEVETEPNKGSRFYFKIKETPKLEKNPANSDSNKNSINVSNKRLIRNYPFKVLIVDDDEINMFLSRTLVKELLPNSIILEAINGKEAVTLFKNSFPDIIFMDIQMPEMNGYEATVEIRKLEPENKTPIIALTAGTKLGDREKCISYGMNDYASKPVIKETFHGLLEKWISPEIIF